MYVVLSGSGQVKLDDELIDVRPWDVVRVAPGIFRGFRPDRTGSSCSRSAPTGPRAATAFTPTIRGGAKTDSATGDAPYLPSTRESLLSLSASVIDGSGGATTPKNGRMGGAGPRMRFRDGVRLRRNVLARVHAPIARVFVTSASPAYNFYADLWHGGVIPYRDAPKDQNWAVNNETVSA